MPKLCTPGIKCEGNYGQGIQADYESTKIHIGNTELFTEKNNQLPDDMKGKVEELEMQGNTTMLVQQKDKFIGIITSMEVARQDAKETLAALNKIGIQNTCRI